MNLWVVLSVVFALGIITWTIIESIWVVHQNTKWAVRRWGVHNRIITAGLNWRWPFADQRAKRMFSTAEDVLPLELRGSAGGKLPLYMKMVITIVDVVDNELIARLAYELVDHKKLLRQRAEAAILELLLPLTFDDVMDGTRRAELTQQLREHLAGVAAACGFRITDLRITEISHEATIQTAMVADGRAQVVRATEAAEAAHKNGLLTAAATAAAAADAITAKAQADRLEKQAAQVKAVIAQLRESRLDDVSAASVVTALLHQQTATTLANTDKAQVILPPIGVDLNHMVGGR